MFMSQHQNAGQTRKYVKYDRSFGNVTKHFGMAVTNQNYIREEINQA
jgi:hypothetical protein